MKIHRLVVVCRDLSSSKPPIINVFLRNFSTEYTERLQNLRKSLVSKEKLPKRVENSSALPRKNSEDPTSIRINRCLPGYSRRQADVLIHEGRVQINGRKAVIGEFLIPGDELKVDKTLVNWEAYTKDQFQPFSNQKENHLKSSHVYLKVWKEKNVICTASVNDGMNNLLQAYKLATHFPGVRLFPVGRLDKDSTGLLLLTSDPSFQTALLAPERKEGKVETREKIEKVYEVTLDREASPEVLEKWRKGFPIQIPPRKKLTNDGKSFSDSRNEMVTIQLKPCKVRRLPQKPSSHTSSLTMNKFPSITYEITLIEGKNRQLRRMASTFGLKVLSIHRTGFCGISLKGLSMPGSWIPLTSNEIQSLQQTLSVSYE